MSPHRRAARRARLATGRPTAHAAWTYRVLLWVAHLVGRGGFGFRPRLVGAEHLPRTADGRPAGGWIAAGLPHRTWVDPFLVADVLPREPRLAFLGDERAMTRAWWRRLLFGRVGGMLPIRPGGRRADVEAHLVAVGDWLTAGAVVVLFPEVGPAAPLGEARRLGLGVAYFALRTGAPIVPLVLGGTHELYRGRRLLVIALPPVDARELAGLPPGAALPAPWTPDERAAAHAVAARLHELTAPAVAVAHRATDPPPGTRRRWRWLTGAWR